MTRKAKIHESHSDILFNFGFAFFDSPVESGVRAHFGNTKVPVLFYGSGPPSRVPGSENAQLILRESTNGACYILEGYFRRLNTSVYTTALIFNQEKRESFASLCGEWYPGVTPFDQPLIVYKNYERIASALLASIRNRPEYGFVFLSEAPLE